MEVRFDQNALSRSFLYRMVFGSLLAGAYFKETIFDIKRLGALNDSALMKFDIPLVL